MPAFLLCVHTNTINKNIDMHTTIRYPDREDKGTARDTSSATSLISKHFTHYTRLLVDAHTCVDIYIFPSILFREKNKLSKEAIYKRERLQTCLFRVGSSHDRERERPVLFVLLSPSCMTLAMSADVFLRQGSKEQRTSGVDGWEGRQQEWSGWKHHQRQSIRCPHQQLPRQHIANDSGVIFGDETSLPTGRVRAPSQAGGCCSPNMKTSFESKTAHALLWISWL